MDYERYKELCVKYRDGTLTNEETKEYEKMKHWDLQHSKKLAVSAVKDFIKWKVYPPDALDKIKNAGTTTEIEHVMCTLRNRYL